MSKEEVKAIVRELKTQAFILGGFIATFWILEIIDTFFMKGALNYYGIRPRNIHWLEGILFAPFLHGDFLHLAANTLPFAILGWLVMLQETSDFFIVTGITALVSGLGIWLFGESHTIHIGASGLIFGYLGFLLLRGYFQRNFISIILSAIVGFLYGSLLWGMLPSLPGISWEGHFFGFVGGVLAARMLSRRK